VEGGGGAAYDEVFDAVAVEDFDESGEIEARPTSGSGRRQWAAERSASSLPPVVAVGWRAQTEISVRAR